MVEMAYLLTFNGKCFSFVDSAPQTIIFITYKLTYMYYNPIKYP